MIPFTLALIALGVIYIVGCFLVELECFGWATVVLIATGIAVQYLHVADILTYVSQNILTSVKWVSIYLVLGVIWSFVKWGFFLLKFRDKFREVKQKFLNLNKLPLNSTSPDDENISYTIKFAFEKYFKIHATTLLEVNTSANDLNVARGTLWLAFLNESKTPNNYTIPTTLKDSFEVFLREQHSYGEYGTLRDGKKPVVIENKKRVIAWMSLWPCSIIGFLFNDLVRRIFTFIFNRLNGLYQKLADAVFANDPELK